MLRVTSLVLLSIVFVFAKTAEKEEETYKNPLSHGFGDDVEWVKWDDAVETAMDVEKPIFLLIHKTWCHACQSLKKSFQQSSAQKAFVAMSKYFVMVNTEDDEEPWEEEYKPDGKYIPRILFLDKNGELLTDFKNTKAAYEKYQYYYSSPAEVITAMKAVLKKFGIEVPEAKKAPGSGLSAAEEAKKEQKSDESKGPEGPKGDAPPKIEKPIESKKSDEEPKKPKEAKEEAKKEAKEEVKKEAKESKEPKKDEKETKETKKAAKEPKAPSAKPPADSKPADSKPADKKEKKEKKDKKSEL